MFFSFSFFLQDSFIFKRFSTQAEHENLTPFSLSTTLTFAPLTKTSCVSWPRPIDTFQADSAEFKTSHALQKKKKKKNVWLLHLESGGGGEDGGSQ